MGTAARGKYYGSYTLNSLENRIKNIFDFTLTDTVDDIDRQIESRE